MIKRYSAFEELIEDMKDRDGDAFLVASEEDKSISHITYKEFAEMVESEIYSVRAACSTLEVVPGERKIENIVRIFACAIAKCDVIISDSTIDPMEIEGATVAAEVDRERRMWLRDGRGKLTEADKEGELLFFTSGTTSRSKMVRLTPESVLTSAWSGQCMLQCTPDDIILCALPLSHAYGFVCSMLWGLTYGATIALARGRKYFAVEPRLFKPTIIPTVPSLMDAWLKFHVLNRELKTVVVGAAPFRDKSIKKLRKSDIKVYIGYGLSETSSGIAISQDLDEPNALYPCPEADIQIEKDGEITVATPCMMQGYLGKYPMQEGDRFYTGDIGEFDEQGRLHLKGRKKDVLLMPDGTKIYCPEYEEYLIKESGVRDIGLVQKDGHAVLIAGRGSHERALRKAVAELNRFLPTSQQIWEVIVIAESLPRTNTGKLKRAELQSYLG